ncbi:hypothetical protein [Brevibacillus sp. BC25]|uniref:BclA C-terminal domain-containing protein n=1 Tax=Brevibacillus sp. BC25 TaxID=1144308 RepID=UPI0002713053|nr:hypothetical protein [Brevibacillus sp. BC25]EJL29978.1 hypothetical protein PMI05_01594 [Brevibacillus sp. BC25]
MKPLKNRRGQVENSEIVVGSFYYLANSSTNMIFTGLDIPFSSSENLNGVIHQPGTAAIIVSESGDYQFDYSVNITAGFPPPGGQIALTVNGIAKKTTILVVPGEVTDSVELTLNAGDVVTLKNTLMPLTLAVEPTKGVKLEITKKK